MTRLPPEERPTAAELANGKTAPGICPKCGCGHLEANSTRELPTGTIHRYRYCRNPKCGARFLTSQPQERIVREVKPHRSEDEPPVLKVRSA